MASLSQPKSPAANLFIPLSNSLILSSSLSNVTVTNTLTLTPSPSVNINSSVMSPILTELSVAPSPPILPPRLSKNETTNNSLFVEATAPPRPPKPTLQIPHSASIPQMNKLETDLLNISSDQNDEKTTPEQNSPQAVELESEEVSNVYLAPPLPPKPLLKQSIKNFVTVSSS